MAKFDGGTRVDSKGYLVYCIPCYDKPLPVQPDLPRYLVEPGLFDKDEEDQA